MTPLPKRRLSTYRQGKRRASFKIKLAGGAICDNCHKLKLPGKVCPHCGYFKGRSVRNP